MMYDRPRADFDPASVGVRQPGGSSSDRTDYPASQGHRRPAPRELARRRLVQVNADTGSTIVQEVEGRLRADVEDVKYRRDKAHGQALGAHLRAADSVVGSVGGGLHLAGPHEALSYLILGH